MCSNPTRAARFSEYVLVNRMASAAESTASRSNCLMFEAPANTDCRKTQDLLFVYGHTYLFMVNAASELRQTHINWYYKIEPV